MNCHFLRCIALAASGFVPLVPFGAAAQSVAASSDDGNGPANTLDGDFATRWSAKGLGQWIAYDLGSNKIIDDVQIAFYRGRERNAYFSIDVSVDRATWIPTFSGQSARNDGLQRFQVDDLAGRYVRITGSGNSNNRWNSYTEVVINTLADAEPPPSTNEQETLWRQDFDQADGSTGSDGPAAWTTSAPGIKSSGYLAVVNGKLEARNTGPEVVWSSGVFDISQYQNLQLQAGLSSGGALDQPDYVQLAYQLNAGEIRRLPRNSKDVLDTTFAWDVAGGETLRLFAYFKSSASDEFYAIDHIAVVGTLEADPRPEPEPVPDPAPEPDPVPPPGDILDPTRPPGGNFNLSQWKLTFPDASERDAGWLSNGGTRQNIFFTDTRTGGMVFRCPNQGNTTSSQTKYSRTELREMLRGTDTSMATKGITGNNWVLSTASAENQAKAGGVDGIMSAVLQVDRVSRTGPDYMIGRVVVGQIHGSDDEPARLYYRKLPGNTHGSVYLISEQFAGDDVKYPLIGSWENDADNPADGIALGERWGYIIELVGFELTVIIVREDSSTVSTTVTIDSDYANDWMYFKAGAYNQNNAGDAGEYVQATFFNLTHEHL